MPAGDWAQYRLSSTTQFNTAAWTQVVLDTTDWEDSDTFSMSSGTVTLKEAGLYLAIINTHWEDVNKVAVSSTARSERSHILMRNGTSTEIESTRHHIYIRRQEDNYEAWATGVGVFSASANDTVSFCVLRTDSTSRTAQIMAGECTLQLLKLDDSWDYIELQKNGTQDTYDSTTPLEYVWDTQNHIDTDTFGHTAGEAAVTLKEAGKYLAVVTIACNISTTVRTGVNMDIELAGTKIATISSYLRGTDSCQNGTLVWAGIIEASANDTFEALWYRSNVLGGSPIRDAAYDSVLSIVKIPDHTNVARYGRNVDQAASSAANFPFEVDIEEDLPFIQDGTNLYEFEIEEGRPILILGSFYTDRGSSSSGVRIVPHLYWELNGSAPTGLVGSSQYNRGVQGGNDVLDAGLVFGGMMDVEDGDVLTFLTENDTTSTDSLCVYDSDMVNIQFVSLASLFYEDDWQDRNRKNRIRISIDHSYVDATLTDYPLLIALGNASGTNSADVSAVFDALTSDDNRKRISVFTEDGIQCPVEIQKWDDANEEAILWTKVPSISSTAKTILYLYYDSDSEENTEYVGDIGDAVAQDVWDDNYVAVWHFEGTDYLVDSTGKTDDLTNSGTTSATGKIGECRSYDNDYLSVTDSNLDVTSAFTLSCWYKAVSGYQPYATLSEKSNGFNNRNWWLSFSQTLYYDWLRASSEGTANTVQVDSGVEVISDLDWHFTSARFDKLTTTAKIDVDDTNHGSQTNTNSTDLDGEGETLYIGNYYNLGTYYWMGLIDEMRVSDIARSDAWVKADYYNQDDSLVSFGKEEDMPIYDKKTATIMVL